MATSGADVVGNCSGTAVEFVDNFASHMAAYGAQSFGQAAESFMFNVMSNSINYRENIFNIQRYEAQGFTPGIYQEVIAFIWETFLFENLYVLEIEDFTANSELLGR